MKYGGIDPTFAFMLVLIVALIIAGMAYHDTLDANKDAATACIDDCYSKCSGWAGRTFTADTSNGCICACPQDR